LAFRPPRLARNLLWIHAKHQTSPEAFDLFGPYPNPDARLCDALGEEYVATVADEQGRSIAPNLLPTIISLAYRASCGDTCGWEASAVQGLGGDGHHRGNLDG